MTRQFPTRRAAVIGALTLFALPRPGSAEGLPKMVVTKEPTCGCCTGWADHIRAAGFPVEIVESSEIGQVKARLGVPPDLAACHTAEIGGYVIEGHVPADAIKRLLERKPVGRGLAVPGMPVGSPGMEMDGMAAERYEVVIFGPSGRTMFARYEGARAL